MRIVNGKIFIGHEFVEGGLEFDRVIRRVGDEVPGNGDFDVQGDYVIPGLVDIHTHGAEGEDAGDGNTEGLRRLSKFYAVNGVTGWVPTLMTLGEQELTKALETIRDFTCPGQGARLLGVNLEGPFISREKCGAQNPEAVQLPDIGLLLRFIRASGNLIRLMTVAPETTDCMELIREASKRCTVSIGHTTAAYETAMEAFRAGATHTAHLYNAMPPLHHRDPGVISAAFDAGATVELIADGNHVAPAVVRMTARLFGEKLVLVSDSGRCTGMPDGEYDLGGQRITLKDGEARLTGTDTLACSAVSLMECVRRAVSFGVRLEDAVYAATTAPSRVIGAEHVGSLEVGKCADIVILDSKLQVKAVFLDGQVILRATEKEK
ncbi:MAG: N-acetylglucosamine-6-phosphate deacetylase [Acetatifactor sp.]